MTHQCVRRPAFLKMGILRPGRGGTGGGTAGVACGALPFPLRRLRAHFYANPGSHLISVRRSRWNVLPPPRLLKQHFNAKAIVHSFSRPSIYLTMSQSSLLTSRVTVVPTVKLGTSARTLVPSGVAKTAAICSGLSNHISKTL